MKRCPCCRTGSLLLETKRAYDMNPLGVVHPAPKLVADSMDAENFSINKAFCTHCKKEFPTEKTKSGVIRIKWPKVFICLVVWHGASPSTEAQILEAMMGHGRRQCQCCHEESGFIVGRGKTQSSLLPVARNNAAKMALKTDAEYVLFVDQDTSEFDYEAILRLACHNLPIVSSYVCRRCPPYDPVHKYLAADGNLIHPQPDEKEMERLDKGLVEECWGVGMAFTMVRRDVLEALGEPYFRFVPAAYNNDDGNQGWFHGEDHSFCINARKKGFKTYIDCGIHLGHMREEATSVDDWLAFNAKVDAQEQLAKAEAISEKEMLIKTVKGDTNE